MCVFFWNKESDIDKEGAWIEYGLLLINLNRCSSKARIISSFNNFVYNAINLTCATGKDWGHILLRRVELITNFANILITFNYFAEVIKKNHCRVRFWFKHELHLTFLIKPSTRHEIKGNCI